MVIIESTARLISHKPVHIIGRVYYLCPYPLVEVNEMLTVYSFSVHRELKYYDRGRRYNTLTLVCCSRVVAVACSTVGTRKCIQVETERVGWRGGAVGRVYVTHWSNSGASLWRSAAWPRIHLHGCSSQQVQHNKFHLDQQWLTREFTPTDRRNWSVHSHFCCTFQSPFSFHLGCGYARNKKVEKKKRKKKKKKKCYPIGVGSLLH